MSSAVKKVMILSERSTLLGIADEAVAQRLAHEIEHVAGPAALPSLRAFRGCTCCPAVSLPK